MSLQIKMEKRSLSNNQLFFCWTAQGGSWEGKSIFNGPIVEDGVGGEIVQMLHSPRLSWAPGGSLCGL